MDPLLGGVSWLGLFFLDANEGFMSSNRGDVLRWDGDRWRQIREGDGVSLDGVWGPDRTHVYFVGAGGLVLRFDGTSFQTLPSGTTANLHAIHGISATQMWLVGTLGTTLQFDGVGFSPFPSGTGEELYSVWVASDATAWTVGYNRTIRRFNGTGWTTPVQPTLNTTFHTDFFAVSGSGPTDVVVAGTFNFRWNGTSWTAMSPNPAFELTGLLVIPGGVWATGRAGLAFWDGTAWALVPSTNGLMLAIARAGSQLFAVGDQELLVAPTGSPPFKDLMQTSYFDHLFSAAGRPLAAQKFNGGFALYADAGWVETAAPPAKVEHACWTADGLLWAQLVDGQVATLVGGVWLVSPGAPANDIVCLDSGRLFIHSAPTGVIERQGTSWVTLPVSGYSIAGRKDLYLLNGADNTVRVAADGGLTTPRAVQIWRRSGDLLDTGPGDLWITGTSTQHAQGSGGVSQFSIGSFTSTIVPGPAGVVALAPLDGVYELDGGTFTNVWPPSLRGRTIDSVACNEQCWAAARGTLFRRR